MVELENGTDIVLDVNGGTTVAAIQLSTATTVKRHRRAVDLDDGTSDKLTNYITIIDPYAKGDLTNLRSRGNKNMRTVSVPYCDKVLPTFHVVNITHHIFI